MIKIFYISIVLCFYSVIVNAAQVELTPLEIQSIQTREYEKGIDVVFPSVVSVFQDLGYIIKTADKYSGFINAESPSQGKDRIWLGGAKNSHTAATAFIEKIGKLTRVRLNFVDVLVKSSEYGSEKRNDAPILDSNIYRNAFERIENAIFVRSSN